MLRNNVIYGGCYCLRSSVSLLSSSSGTWTTELSGFTSTGISHQKGSVVLEKQVLDLSLLGLIDEFLVEGDDSLGDCLHIHILHFNLSNRIDLSGTTTTAHLDTDVQAASALVPQEQEGLEGLVAEGHRLNEIDGGSVHADHTYGANIVGQFSPYLFRA